MHFGSGIQQSNLGGVWGSLMLPQVDSPCVAAIAVGEAAGAPKTTPGCGVVLLDWGPADW
jgi:hypothetical protein